METGAGITTERQVWMGLTARAPQGRLAALCTAARIAPAFERLRPPEIGTVMVRGRAGGTGAPFNLGEVTVTRASVRLAMGAVGHGYVQGRDKAAAEWAAIVDALMQGPEADMIRREVLDPIATELTDGAKARAAKAAATKVEFFTLVRGED
jgi:alpha-D-ribose 1-methylphosphonate 5-triphosphate synthase subunit PhnG